jgi:predicted ATP-dependent endonuclease of OLD family
MNISSVRLKNFRSYKNGEPIEGFARIMALIGQNNVGKSNVIRALMWYKDMALNRKTFSIELLHSANKSNPLRFEIEFQLDSTERDAIFNLLALQNEDSLIRLKNSQFFQRVKHEVEFTSKENLVNETILISDVSGSWFPILGYSNNTHLQLWKANIEELVTNYQAEVQDISASNFNKKIIGPRQSRPERAFDWQFTTQIETRLKSLITEYIGRWIWISPLRRIDTNIPAGPDSINQASGENVLRRLSLLLGEDYKKAIKILKEIYNIIPDLRQINVPLRKDVIQGVVKELGNVVVEMEGVGSGLSDLIILIFTISNAPKNCLFFIEEPEMHLHALAQRALFRLMKKKAKTMGHQFVITTHSTIFTEISDDVNTLLVKKHRGVSHITRLTERHELHYLKYALGHQNTDLFGFNAVLLVEGGTEEKALPILAESLSIDFIKLGIKVINVEGTGNTTRINELTEFLRDSDTIVFFMVDNHSKAVDTIDNLVRRKLVRKEHIFYFEKGFEDCFDNETLAKSLNEVAKDKGVELQVTVDELSSYRNINNKISISKYLKEMFWERTKGQLSKPELGMKIARLVAENKSGVLTLPQSHLKKINQIIVRKFMFEDI